MEKYYLVTQDNFETFDSKKALLKVLSEFEVSDDLSDVHVIRGVELNFKVKVELEEETSK